MNCSRSVTCNDTDRPTRPTQSLATEFSAWFKYALAWQSVFLQNLTCCCEKRDFYVTDNGRTVSYNLTSCSLFGMYWRFRATDCLYRKTWLVDGHSSTLMMKSRFLRNVGVTTTRLSVATQKLLIFLILSSSSDRQLNFRATWPAQPASSLMISPLRRTILVTFFSAFHNLIRTVTKTMTFISVCKVARQCTVRKKRKTLAHKSSRGSNNKQCVIFIHLSWIQSRHMALLDTTNATVTCPPPCHLFC